MQQTGTYGTVSHSNHQQICPQITIQRICWIPSWHKAKLLSHSKQEECTIISAQIELQRLEVSCNDKWWRELKADMKILSNIFILMMMMFLGNLVLILSMPYTLHLWDYCKLSLCIRTVVAQSHHSRLFSLISHQPCWPSSLFLCSLFRTLWSALDQIPLSSLWPHISF